MSPFYSLHLARKRTDGELAKFHRAPDGRRSTCRRRIQVPCSKLLLMHSLRRICEITTIPLYSTYSAVQTRRATSRRNVDFLRISPRTARASFLSLSTLSLILLHASSQTPFPRMRSAHSTFKQESKSHGSVTSSDSDTDSESRKSDDSLRRRSGKEESGSDSDTESASSSDEAEEKGKRKVSDS